MPGHDGAGVRVAYRLALLAIAHGGGFCESHCVRRAVAATPAGAAGAAPVGEFAPRVRSSYAAVFTRGPGTALPARPRRNFAPAALFLPDSQGDPCDEN